MVVLLSPVLCGGILELRKGYTRCDKTERKIFLSLLMKFIPHMTRPVSTVKNQKLRTAYNYFTTYCELLGIAETDEEFARNWLAVKLGQETAELFDPEIYVSIPDSVIARR